MIEICFKGIKTLAGCIYADIAEAISMSDRVAILTQRPATINEIVDIKFSTPNNSPLKCREEPEFRIYFNKIWKELN